MKLSVLVVLAACLQVSAKGYSQETFSLHFRQADVSSIFSTIQKESHYKFFYNNDYLRELGKVDLDVTDAPLTNILQMVLRDKFTYKIGERKVIISPAALPGVLAPDSAARPVKGQVTDETGKGLGGVTVRVVNGQRATTTDANGNFTIEIEGTQDLAFSYVGYKSQTVNVKAGQKLIPVQLSPNGGGLTDAVVVGYGVQRKRDVTGSISSVKGDDIQNLAVSNAADAIQGRATGVDIVHDDGAPGSVPSIRVLGTGTINDADPLVVIDGVPSGGLNDVNANDIASIEILKDASASAIYGSRAANGVVLITTKKGTYEDKINVSANVYGGVKSPTKFINMLTAPQLVALKNEAYNNDGLPVPTIWSNPYYATQRTDWQRALIGNGDVSNADVAVRGGSKNSQYSISGNFYDEKGMIINQYFKRYSVRINSEHKIGSRLKVGENAVYSYTTGTINGTAGGAEANTHSSQTGLIWSAIRFNPALPVVDSTGNWGSSQADPQLGDINNPVATATETNKYNNIDRVLANAYVELEIVRGLKLRANYGYDHNTDEYYEWDNAMPDQTRGPAQASLTQNYSKETTVLTEYYLTYNHTWGDHSLTATGGYSAQQYSGNLFGASRSGFTDTGSNQRILNLGTQSIGNQGYQLSPWGLESGFVRANYGFANKYLLTATFRADGSSRFAPGKQWGYFPAFSAGWRISDETFFAPIKNTINSLKLTGGWGQLGNQNVNPFQYLSIIQQSAGNGYPIGGSSQSTQPGAFITSLANPNITWERAVTTTVALEFATLNNHLNGTVTYFNKNTSHMLIPYQLVETFGAMTNLPDDPGNVSLPDYNIGQMNNHGVELELSYRNTVGKVTYTIGVNGSYLRNKVTRLYGAADYIAGTTYGRENVDISRTYAGQPIASFYGYKADGLYQTQEDINNDPNIANDPNKPNIKPGDVKFRDINGDGVISDSDRVRLGDPNPKFVFGFNGTVNYAHFDLTFNFSGALGFQLYDADRLAGLDATQVYNWYAQEEGRWHGEGTSNSIPRLSINNLNNNYQSSNLWVFSGNYLSLKSLTLGYTLPKFSVNDWKIPQIRIYASSYNLFMWTKYPGYTPELGYTSVNSGTPGLQRGVDLAQYPPSRSFTIGGTVNF
jgi:TonB-dependent starch-binding outer membrane protein SusC